MKAENSFLKYNDKIKNAIQAYNHEESIENVAGIVNAIDECMRLDGHFLIPVETEPDAENPERTHYWMREIDTEDGRYLAVFTDDEELHKGPETAVISFFIDALFEKLLLAGECDGVVINPWGEFFYLSLSFVKLVLILSQLRKMYTDLQVQGEKVWENAEISKEKQARYYSLMQDSLDEFQNYPDLAAFYWEIVGLYKDIFVTYWFDEKEQKIYQAGADGECYVLQKGKPNWKQATVQMFSGMKKLRRQETENMEDAWNVAFWNAIESDLKDFSVHLYSSKSRSLEFRISNGKITFAGEDFGEECYKISGKRFYEFYYTLKKEQSEHFFAMLRTEYGIEKSLEDILKEKFSCQDGSEKFKEYCDKIGEQPGFFSF